MRIIFNKFRVSLFTFLMLLVPVAVLADIKGTVFDENHEPVIGASVLIEGTTQGTITDFDGVFVLEVREGQNRLWCFQKEQYIRFCGNG